MTGFYGCRLQLRVHFRCLRTVHYADQENYPTINNVYSIFTRIKRTARSLLERDVYAPDTFLVSNQLRQSTEGRKNLHFAIAMGKTVNRQSSHRKTDEKRKYLLLELKQAQQPADQRASLLQTDGDDGDWKRSATGLDEEDESRFGPFVDVFSPVLSTLDLQSTGR